MESASHGKTPPNRPEPTLVERARTAFRAVTLPQAVVVAAIVAGTLYAFGQLPDERLQWLIATLGALGGMGTLVLSPRPVEPPAAPPPPPARVGRKDGSSSDMVLWALAGAAFAFAWLQRLGAFGVLVLAVAASGCGAGAIQAHVTASAVAWEVLERAEHISQQAREERSALCHDVPCLEEVQRIWAPLVLASDGARGAWTFWVSGVHLAHMSGTSEGMEGAAIAAALRFFGLYGDLAQAFAGIGVSLPTMPDLALSRVGGAE